MQWWGQARGQVQVQALGQAMQQQQQLQALWAKLLGNQRW
jgi:hypothetical protein